MSQNYRKSKLQKLLQITRSPNLTMLFKTRTDDRLQKQQQQEESKAGEEQ